MYRIVELARFLYLHNHKVEYGPETGEVFLKSIGYPFENHFNKEEDSKHYVQIVEYLIQDLFLM